MKKVTDDSAPRLAHPSDECPASSVSLPCERDVLEWLLSHTAIVETNRFGKILTVLNPGGNLLAQDPADLIGHSLLEYFQERGAHEFAAAFRRVTRRREERRCELRLRNGCETKSVTARLRPFSRTGQAGVVTILQCLQGKSFFVEGLGHACPLEERATHFGHWRSEAEARLRESESRLHKLSAQLMRVADEERRRFARNLHETVAQSLAAVKMTIGKLGRRLPEDDKEIRELLAAAMTLTNQALQEVRTITHLMHPPLLDLAGLVPALRAYAEGFAVRSGIAMTVETDEDIPRLDQETETTVFRLVQEALTNVHRHSGSVSAIVRLTFDEGWLRVEIQDFGHGMKVPINSSGEPSPQCFGVGLSGIRERILQVSGILDISSRPGEGTLLRASLPISFASLHSSGRHGAIERPALRG